MIIYTKIDHTINGEIKRLLLDFMWPTVLYRTICICIYGFGYDDRSGSLQNIIVPRMKPFLSGPSLNYWS